MSDDNPATRKFIFRRDQASARPNKKILSDNGPGKSKNSPHLFSECTIKNLCGKCKYINEPYQKGLKEKHQLGLKSLRKLKLLGSAQFIDPEESPQNLAFKTTVNIIVREPIRAAEGITLDVGIIGTSNKLIDLGSCPLNSPAIGKFIRAMKFHLGHSPLKPWSEKSKSGDLLAVEVTTSHITNEIMLIFEVTKPCKNELRKIISLLKIDEHKINSAHMRVKSDSSDRSKTTRISGTDRLRDSLCDLSVEYSPNSTYPSNPWQSINLYRRIEQLVGAPVDGSEENNVIWDINSSVGIVSLLLAKNNHSCVSFTNSKDTFLQDAIDNGSRNELESKINFLEGSISAAFSELSVTEAKPKVIIINSTATSPLSTDDINIIKNAIANSPQCKVIYQSSQLSQLQSEIEQICGSSLVVRQVESFDIAPQTDALTWLLVATY